MAGDSFRDRFFTKKVSRAITAPSSILTFGAATAVGIVALSGAGPFGIAGGFLIGAAAYATKVLTAVPRKPRKQDIDPFGVNEPWRRFVSDALKARARLEASVAEMQTGPLRDTLSQIGHRLQDAVDECWRVARRGQSIANARSLINVESARYELEQARGRSQEPPAPGSTLARTVEALDAQIASADRMDLQLVETVDRLRLLDARMDETVTRAIELAVQADSPDDLGGLGADVDSLVLDMEALRQALDETNPGRAGPDLAAWDAAAAQASTQPRPATQLSTTQPPAIQPPTTQPPAIQPPATQPPTTQPPATQPPATQPPATQPPATQPPTTQPPTTHPPSPSPPAGRPSTGPPSDDGQGPTEPPTASGAS